MLPEDTAKSLSVEGFDNSQAFIRNDIIDSDFLQESELNSF